MLKDFTPSRVEEITEYSLVFDDGHNNGFAFACDAAGALLFDEETNPLAFANYRNCLGHPEQFVRFGEVVGYPRLFKVPGHGTCSCGHEVNLYNQCQGACQCPNCGQWYNLFGQELLPPEQWEHSV